jgi:hypothetical protein
MLLLESDGGVDPTGVDLKIMKLVLRNGGDGAVCRRTELQIALDAVMFDKGRS